MTKQRWIDQARRGLTMENDGGWLAAEAMFNLSEDGMPQRQIAARVGVSQSTVSRYVTCWREFGDSEVDRRPSWRDAYGRADEIRQRRLNYLAAIPRGAILQARYGSVAYALPPGDYGRAGVLPGQTVIVVCPHCASTFGSAGWEAEVYPRPIEAAECDGEATP